VTSPRTAMTLLVLPLVAVGLAGCGSSSTPTTTAPTSGFGARSTSSTTTAAPTTTGSSGSSTPAAPGQVAIVDYDFTPNTVTVAVGDTVTWTNQDRSDHWVVSAPTSPASFDLGRQTTSAAVSHTFTAPGSYPYFCNLHNYMKGTVEVR